MNFKNPIFSDLPFPSRQLKQFVAWLCFSVSYLVYLSPHYAHSNRVSTQVKELDKYAHGVSLPPLTYMFAFPLCCGDKNVMTCPALEDYVKMCYYTSGSWLPKAKSIGQFECIPSGTLCIH